MGEAPDAPVLTVDAALAGTIDMRDVRMSPDALEHQAAVAREHRNPQLAENFLRAAELTRLEDEEVMDLYEALRPHRSTAEELQERARHLEERGAVRCAALVREAADIHTRRGLVR